MPRRASHGIRRLLVHPPRHRVPLLTAAPAPTSTDPARLFAFRPSSRTPRPALRPSRGARHGGRPHRYARPPRPLHPPAARPSREAVPAAASRNIRPLVLVCTNGGEGGRTKRGAPTAPRRKSNAAARGSHAQRRGGRRASSRSHHSRNHDPRSPRLRRKGALGAASGPRATRGGRGRPWAPRRPPSPPAPGVAAARSHSCSLGFIGIRSRGPMWQVEEEAI